MFKKLTLRLKHASSLFDRSVLVYFSDHRVILYIDHRIEETWTSCY